MIYRLKQQLVKLTKKVFGITDLTFFLKKQKKSFFKKIYKKKYTSDDLIEKMKLMGMKNGSVVFIHSSMTEFYNFIGSPNELIAKIIETIGDEGTLLMPSYPKLKKTLGKENQIDGVDFDVLKTPSGAGYLSEIFRKYPGVKRSINQQHSVCAYGKLADFFVSEHHLSETPWDEKSPYYKMSLTNTMVFALGLPYFLTTTIHCTESLLWKKYKYFSLFFNKKLTYSYRDENGAIGIHEMFCSGSPRQRNKKKIIKKYFNPSEFHCCKLSNLRIEMVYAKYTLELFLKLAENGITMFSIPSPKKYKQNGRFIPETEKRNN